MIFLNLNCQSCRKMYFICKTPGTLPQWYQNNYGRIYRSIDAAIIQLTYTQKRTICKCLGILTPFKPFQVLYHSRYQNNLAVNIQTLFVLYHFKFNSIRGNPYKSIMQHREYQLLWFTISSNENFQYICILHKNNNKNNINDLV